MTESIRPYSPSWVDRFIHWIDSLPIPAWLFYLFNYLLAALFLHAAVWLDGVTAVGEISPIWLINALWSVTSIIFLHIMKRAAKQAAEKFAPVVPEKHEQLDELRYRLTNLPAKPVFWLTLVMILSMGWGLLTIPGFMYRGTQHPLSFLLGGGVFLYSYSFTLIMFFNTIRQLYLVTKIYNLVEDVNVFHQEPLYAFSGLSVRAGLLWVLLVNLNFLGSLVEVTSESEVIISFWFSISALIIAFAAFLVPLWGIHKRIAEAKQNALEENSIQIEQVQRKLYTAVDKEKYTEVAGLGNSLGSLYQVRQQVKGLPTWPWAPGTLRSFLSAVFIPMLLWGLQVFLSRYLAG